MSNPFVQILLVLVGLVEFLVRAVALTALCVVVIGIVLLGETETTPNEFLHPAAWKLLN